jgi:hypothetical protein
MGESPTRSSATMFSVLVLQSLGPALRQLLRRALLELVLELLRQLVRRVELGGRLRHLDAQVGRHEVAPACGSEILKATFTQPLSIYSPFLNTRSSSHTPLLSCADECLSLCLLLQYVAVLHRRHLILTSAFSSHPGQSQSRVSSLQKLTAGQRCTQDGCAF